MDNVPAVDDDHAPLATTTASSSPPTVETIVDAIASARGTTPRELPPLYQSIDVGALERVFATDGHRRVTFEYQSLLVTVDADGTVEVYDRS